VKGRGQCYETYCDFSKSSYHQRADGKNNYKNFGCPLFNETLPVSLEEKTSVCDVNVKAVFRKAYWGFKNLQKYLGKDISFQLRSKLSTCYFGWERVKNITCITCR
jgi:hypothetical protein